jgi:erythromycin esterase
MHTDARSSADERASFLRWAREKLTPVAGFTAGAGWEDLAPLGRMIGEAPVVALSEGEHFCAEPLQFRNRLLEYLVEQKGFTAIAIESGVVEARGIHDYVLSGQGDLSSVVTQGISWTFDKLPQNRALIRWLAAYNADRSPARKINFYGFDIPGSPSNPRATRGAETALLEALRFLERVDDRAAAAFRNRIDGVLPLIRFEPYRTSEVPGYHTLGQAERDALTATVADLVALLERREARYVAASSQRDYEWAWRAAIGARQTDGWLRELPLGWTSQTDLRFLDSASDLRDRAQADNLQWIMDREGPRGKVLVYAHNNHVGMTSVSRSWFPLNVRGQLDGHATHTYVRAEVAGGYLRRRLGDRLVTIGNLIGRGELGAAGFHRTLEEASVESLDAIARDVGVPLFLLDLRDVPARSAAWLNQQREIGRLYEVYGRYRLRSEISVCSAFDLLFFVDSVTPAREADAVPA